MKRISRTHLQSIIIATCLALLNLSGTASADQLIYNVNSDWSDTHNPNGAWSYNYGDSPIPIHQTFYWGGAGWGTLDFAESSILKGGPAFGPDPFGGTVPPPHDWVEGDVMMHATSWPYGGLDTFMNIRWTSPADGTIDITGRAWDGMIQPYGDRDVAWALLVGGETIAQHLSTVGVFRTDANAQFGANLVEDATLTGIPVLQGDIVEFRVISTTYYGQFVGLEQSITLTAVPEVGSVPLFLAGLAAIALRHRFSGRFTRTIGFA